RFKIGSKLSVSLHKLLRNTLGTYCLTILSLYHANSYSYFQRKLIENPLHLVAYPNRHMPTLNPNEYLNVQAPLPTSTAPQNQSKNPVQIQWVLFSQYLKNPMLH